MSCAQSFSIRSARNNHNDLSYHFCGEKARFVYLDRACSNSPLRSVHLPLRMIGLCGFISVNKSVNKSCLNAAFIIELELL